MAPPRSRSHGAIESATRIPVVVSWLCLTILLVGIPDCRAGTDSSFRKILGGIGVKGGDASGSLPQRAPQTLDAEDYAGDELIEETALAALTTP